MRNSSYEYQVLEAIIDEPRAMDYKYQQSKAANRLTDICNQIINPLIDYEVDNNTVKKLKLNIETKKERCRLQGDYGICLLDNIYFELYKYDIIKSIFDLMKELDEELINMDYEAFIKVMLKYCQDSFVDCQDFMDKNPKSRMTLQRYNAMNIQDREYAYVLSFLKTNTAIDTMQKILHGRIELNRRVTTWYKVIDEVPLWSSDKKAVFDRVITKAVDGKLSAMYKNI